MVRNRSVVLVSGASLFLGFSACKKDASSAAPPPARIAATSSPPTAAKAPPAAAPAPTPPAAPAAPAAAPAPPAAAPAAPAAALKLDFPGNAGGAMALIREFLKPTTDRAALTRALKPTKADYAALFVEAVAAKAEASYEALWNNPRAMIKPNEGQTDVLFFGAKTEELKAGTGNSGEFPGGYKRAAASFKPGLTIYRFKYVKPGERLGMAYDGLVYVNGHWAWFPKPWRVTE